MQKKYRYAPILIGAVGYSASAFGSPIAGIEQQASGSSAVLDQSPVITAIYSAPIGLSDGYTYSKWAVYANDGSSAPAVGTNTYGGSVDIFGALNTNAYTPVVGDKINIPSGATWSPFDGIPEVSATTATVINKVSSGNPVPSPTLVTIPQVLALAPLATNYNIVGYPLALDNVEFSSIPVSGIFPVHANLDINLTDGTNTLEGFYWPSSYSAEDIYAGTTVPTGPVDVTGFLSEFGTGTAAVLQFTPITITSVPEPTSLSMLALGGIGLIRRRARKA